MTWIVHRPKYINGCNQLDFRNIVPDFKIIGQLRCENSYITVLSYRTYRAYLRINQHRRVSEKSRCPDYICEHPDVTIRTLLIFLGFNSLRSPPSRTRLVVGSSILSSRWLFSSVTTEKISHVLFLILHISISFRASLILTPTSRPLLSSLSYFVYWYARLFNIEIRRLYKTVCIPPPFPLSNRFNVVWLEDFRAKTDLYISYEFGFSF